MSTQENLSRLGEVYHRAAAHGIDGAEHIRRIIQGAVRVGNPFVHPDDHFIVLGVDGFDGSIFPCGSFNTPEEAETAARKKIEEEPLFSDSEEISTSFHVFSKDGCHIPLEDPS